MQKGETARVGTGGDEWKGAEESYGGWEGGGVGGGGGLVRWSIMSVVERTNEACMARWR